MTDLSTSVVLVDTDDEQISLLGMASVILRWRRTIIALGFVGALTGLFVGLSSTRMYVSTSTFVPEADGGGASGLALAASQFGLRVPSNGRAWQPALYVDVLTSRTILERIALDTVVVSEQGGRQAQVMDLLQVDAPKLVRRTDIAVLALRDIIKAREDKKLNAIRLSVTTAWPSVSLALAERALSEVNEFNLNTRRSQAMAERKFVEEQAGKAERELREAEDRLQSFLQRNRIAGSPELTFQSDRLKRDISLRQQMFTTLLQNLEDAKIREVRNTPVITILEAPSMPSAGEPRRSVLKGIIGGLTGGLLAVLIAFVFEGIKSMRRAPTEEAREFLRQLEQAVPKILRRRVRP